MNLWLSGRSGVDEGKDLDWWFVRASVHTGTE